MKHRAKTGQSDVFIYNFEDVYLKMVWRFYQLRPTLSTKQ